MEKNTGVEVAEVLEEEIDGVPGVTLLLVEFLEDAYKRCTAHVDNVSNLDIVNLVSKANKIGRVNRVGVFGKDDGFEVEVASDSMYAVFKLKLEAGRNLRSTDLEMVKADFVPE